MIPLTRPTLPPLRGLLLRRLEKIFASGQITNGPIVQNFERACARFLGVKEVVAVSSGSAALLVALCALNIEKGEVIIPSFTFTATGHVLLWKGLTPVFVDINAATFNIDPARVEEAITARTVAIMPVHVFGNPCEIAGLERLARQHRLKIIYDAAHAFGSTYQGRSVAQFGDAACFSLTPSKIFTTGEGGVVTTNDRVLAARMRLARNNGDSFNRSEEFLGISARFTEMAAAIGLSSLSNLKKNLRQRLERVRRYQQKLQEVSGISWQQLTPQTVSAYKDFAVLVNANNYGRSRDALIKRLRGQGIESKAYFYPALHNKKVYKNLRHAPLPTTNQIEQSIISLPLYSHMPFSEIDQVCAVIKSFLRF